MNHDTYHERLDLVNSVLDLNGLEVEKIETVEYDMNAKHPYNNYIYLVTLSSSPSTAIILQTPHSNPTSNGPSPGTVAMPPYTRNLIFKLPNLNPATGINNINRVESEVAFMTLARQALAGSKYSNIVPEIYAWEKPAPANGFTIQQYMHGVLTDKVFEDLSFEGKSAVLSQMAEIIAIFQKFQLPRTVDKFGGLKFDQHGNIVSAQTTVYKREPTATYNDFIRAVFDVKFEEIDENPIMQGWRDKGVRARLDNFIEYQLGEILKYYENPKKVLVHSDYTTNNLLIDPSTLKVTALLDFDFSYVATVIEEFNMFSFATIPGGQLPGPLEDGVQLELRKAILEGYSHLSSTKENSEIQWHLAKAWDDALARTGAARPQTIPNFAAIADVYWLTSIMSPFELENPAMRERRTPQQLQDIRDRTESLIIRFLDKFEQGP